MENDKHAKCRIVTMITKQEKAALQILAADDRRSMAGYIRSLLVSQIEDFFDPQ